MTKKNGIVAWSYSRLDCYNSCPRQFEYRHVLKLQEPKAAPMMRGIVIHNEAAAFLDCSVDEVPDSCEKFEDQFWELRDLKPIVEQKWAFTKGWRSTNYFNKKVRVRVTLDVLVNYGDGTADMIDHKTGKYYPGNESYLDQQTLFAAAVMKKFSDIHKVTARLWFLDTGDEEITELTRDEAFEDLAVLQDKADIMMKATRFPPTPSWKCGGVRKDGTTWGCHWRKSNGGPCEFG